MYDEIGSTEINGIKKMLNILTAMKKISSIFGHCNELVIDSVLDEDELYAMTAIAQFIVFNNLNYNGIALEIFAGDVELVRDDLAKQNIMNEEDRENILIESIVFQFKYKKEAEKKYSEKIDKLIEVLANSDPYESDDISYKPYTVKRFESQWIHEICFPCSIEINEEITNAVINLFI